MPATKKTSRTSAKANDVVTLAESAKRKASATHIDDDDGGGEESATSLRIDGRVARSQIEKACKALVAYRERQRTKSEAGELPLEGDDDVDDLGEGARTAPSDVVWMQITVKTLNDNAPPKPVRIATPHAVYPTTSSVCLFSADPQRTYKDLMVEQRLTQVKRVVGVTKLKGKFKPFEARRQLMNDHDIFLVDDRIVPMLPKLLGKKWISERKTPIPVQLTKTKDGRVRKSVESALASTFFHRNKGTCASVRLGTVRHLTSDQLVDNVTATLPVIVNKHIKGKWANVQSIDIKTGTSAALPVWNCNVGDRWTGMPETLASSNADNNGASEDAATKPTPPKKAKITSKSTTPKPATVKPSISKQTAAPPSKRKVSGKK